MSRTLAFDESVRKGRYIAAVAAYEGSISRQVDQLVRRHRSAPQSPFHATHEHPRRVVAFLRSLADFGLIKVWMYESRMAAAQARPAIIARFATDAAARDTGRIVLDQINPTQDGKDRAVIKQVFDMAERDVIPYSHQKFGTDCGLEIADAAAWAWGVGGDCQTSLAPLIEFETEVG